MDKEIFRVEGGSDNRIADTEEWELTNPVLANGEIGFEVQENNGLNAKVGDGEKHWNELPYFISQLISKALEAYSTCPYDVGDILQTTNAANPEERWPGTKWEVFAPGRVLIGAGTGKDSRNEEKTFTVGETGGEYNHVLTTGELPAHTHTRGTMDITGTTNIHVTRNGTWNCTGAFYHESSGSYLYGGLTGNAQTNGIAFRASKNWTGATSSVGNNSGHNNMSPFSVVYTWKRLT